MKRFIMFLLLILLPLLTGATYYIDATGGNDASNGTSKETAWAHHPWMSNFTGSYTHSAGDIFIFKGGEVWTAPASDAHFITIANSGTAGNVDTFTTDRTWYSGSSWSQPTIAGTGSMAYMKALIYGLFKSYIKINDIKFSNVGTQGIVNTGCAVYFQGGNNIEVSYDTFIPDSAHSFYYYYYASRNDTNLLVHHNDFSRASNCIEIGTGTQPSDASDYSFDNVQVYTNTFHDIQTALLNTDHGDGIHVFGYNYAEDGSAKPSFTNVKIYDNRWSGDFSGGDTVTTNTAQIYFGGGVDGGAVWNNVCTFDNTTGLNTGAYSYEMASGFIYLNYVKNVLVYSNTMAGDSWVDAGYGAKYCLQIRDSYNISVGNNIMSKCEKGVSLYADYWTAGAAKTKGRFVMKTGIPFNKKVYECTSAGTTGESEPNWAASCPNDGDTCSDGSVTWTTRTWLTASYNNLFNPRSGTDDFIARVDSWTLAEWAAAFGYDTNSISGDPLFVGATGTKNLRLQSASPAIGIGAALGEPYNRDIVGTLRPQGAAYDSGAYEFVGGTGSITQGIKSQGLKWQ